MKFRHVFRVDSPVGAVTAFHRQSASMGAITPPPVRVQIHSAPSLLSEGSEMSFTLKIGPLPVRWHACIEDVSDFGFADRQLSGPFARWIHRHTFVPINANQTEVIDLIEARLKPHLFWGLFGLAMWLGMPFLFWYRARKTRSLLSKEPAR